MIGGIFCSGVIIGRGVSILTGFGRGVSILTGSGLGVFAIKLIINEKERKENEFYTT